MPAARQTLAALSATVELPFLSSRLSLQLWGGVWFFPTPASFLLQLECQLGAVSGEFAQTD
jgi:hypothetical protein